MSKDYEIISTDEHGVCTIKQGRKIRTAPISLLEDKMFNPEYLFRQPKNPYLPRKNYVFTRVGDIIKAVDKRGDEIEFSGNVKRFNWVETEKGNIVFKTFDLTKI